MFNPRTKFEVSTISCNKEMKGNAKCKKILVLSHPLGICKSTYTLLYIYITERGVVISREPFKFWWSSTISLERLKLK